MTPSSASTRPRLRILVVEDEWLIGEDLKLLLEDLGHEVLGPALSCAAALDLISRTTPDLALVDTLLGHETCEAVLNELVARAVPILICSGHAETELPEFARSFPLLAKPFSTETVHAALGVRDKEAV